VAGALGDDGGGLACCGGETTGPAGDVGGWLYVGGVAGGLKVGGCGDCDGGMVGGLEDGGGGWLFG
jgi:hypothetical protein